MADPSADSAREPSSQPQAEAEPSQYWGYLFQANKSPTDKLTRLLRGIAACIVSPVEQERMWTSEMLTAQPEHHLPSSRQP